jgi:hypothetical protein
MRSAAAEAHRYYLPYFFSLLSSALAEKIGPYFLCPFVLIQKNEKIKSLIIL